MSELVKELDLSPASSDAPETLVAELRLAAFVIGEAAAVILELGSVRQAATFLNNAARFRGVADKAEGAS